MCDECIKCVRDSKVKHGSFNEPPASYSVRHTLKEEKDAEKKVGFKVQLQLSYGYVKSNPFVGGNTLI